MPVVELPLLCNAKSDKVKHVAQIEETNSSNDSINIHKDSSNDSLLNQRDFLQNEPKNDGTDKEATVADDNIQEHTERTRSTRDRFKCDFCAYHGTRDGMIKHIKGIKVDFLFRSFYKLKIL